MRQRHPTECGKRRGFTLVEVMVATAVLSIILVMLIQMQSVTFESYKFGVARVDVFTQARVLLGLIERDIQSSVIRRDLAAFVDQNGVPACAFYTEFPAPSANRKLSLVQYKFVIPSDITSITSGSAGLLRYDYGYNYPGEGVATTQIDFGNLAKLTNLSAATSQPLGDTVVGFGIQFLRGDGKFQSHYQFAFENPTSISNTQIAVLSLAVLDSSAYQLAQRVGSLSSITTALNGNPGPDKSYAEFWNSNVSQPSFGTALPQPVRSGLHIFERRIAIPVSQLK